MSILSFDGVGVSFGAKTLFSDLSFAVEKGDRVGIIGINGAGKSTLFQLITGKTAMTEGAIYLSRNLEVGIVEQNAAFSGSGTVYEEMLQAFPQLLRMEAETEQLQQQIDAWDSKADPAQRDALVYRYTELCDRFREDGGYSFRSRTRSMLLAAGFPEEMFSMPVPQLSGGQKTRLSLVRTLLSAPDLLLLDEPTNHLDAQTLTWLEDSLIAYPKTVLTISHDRMFLDRVTTKIYALENGHGQLYSGNYSSYAEKRSRDREIQEKHYKNQQREIARIEAYIEQQRRWNRERNIIAAESREKQLAKLTRVERPENDPRRVQMWFQKVSESGNDVMTLEKVTKSYPGKPLFKDINAVVKRGDRVFVTGPNGCGKSTLLKIIAGVLQPDDGCAECGYRVKIGYYDQEQLLLNENNTVLDEVYGSYETRHESEIRSMLARFLFYAEDMGKQVAVLSGGERARLTLCKLMLSEMNLLILDEPTNHLDIPTREVLEDALLHFDGTLIAVSHDRYFSRKLASRVFDLTDGAFYDYHGPLADYAAYKASLSEQKAAADDAPGIATAAKEQFTRAKEEAARRRRLEKARIRVDADTHRTEEVLANIEKTMNGEAACDFQRLTELDAERASLEEKLLSLYAEAEELTKEGF